MKLPPLVSTKRIKRSISAFGGYRHDHRAGADRFYEMKNLSADRFPLLSTRKKRGRAAVLEKPNGLFAGEKLCWADGTQLFYDGECVGSVSDTEKSFVRSGAKILIWPDKLSFNTEDGTLSALGAEFASEGTVSFSMCNLQGEEYQSYAVSDMPPEDPSGGALWLDTAQTPNVLKRYSSLSGMWISLSAAYIKISNAGIGADFSEYDGIEISGAEAQAINGSAVVYAAGEDYLLIAGTLDEAFTQSAELHISREIPDFDFICEKDNRVWGCSSERNEIACCKLGDPGNWNCYMGISTDSYTLSTGGGGSFSGCCAYGNNVLFFKEDRLMKLMGTRPENYQLVTTPCYGLCRGSEKSLCEMGGLLYYHARAGVCAYGGSMPELIGEDLGERLKNAVGGAVEDKYYLSAEDENGETHLFVYDSRCALWHREDESRAKAIVSLGGSGYMLRDDGALFSLDASEGTAEGKLSWYFETGELIDAGYQRPQKLIIRLWAEAGAQLRLMLSFDGGAFSSAGSIKVTRKRPVLVPLRLRRCDSLRLRVEGEGEAALHGLSFVSEEAGE